MTIFYEGSLQEGIALAMREAKAVACFVRDDAQLSSTWEDEYFADNEVAQALGDKSVLLRLTAGTQEAGFLSSFCPVAEFPAVIVIKSGKLEEYLLPGISKEEFKSRVIAVLNGKTASSAAPAQQPQASASAVNNASSAASNLTAALLPAATTPAQIQQSQSASSSPSPAPQGSQESANSKKRPVKQEPHKPTPSKPHLTEEDQKNKSARIPEKKATAPSKSTKSVPSKVPAPTVEQPIPQPPAPRGPPSQYRLQVRLFDGRSIRSSFTPTQTIRGDVRPWLDEQMTDDNRPYNLKHILTPLPNRTLSVAEESQTLQDLGIGSTANLVMVPVTSYTEAYASAAANLPARGITAVYNVVSSVASSATNLVGSLVGYGSSAPENETQASSSAPPPSESARRPRTGGLNIRTLRDQHNERNDSQFYNGNQLNFEPRNQDRKDD
ncbi:uncharacterized protein N7482_009448 [Penicillium canariense]|uniref:UBX domain-containing protein n=1 Tax=Penicillium canariense TaxID=189055 RepID=A0A9W9HQE5_9EURO|nr:uncharacterized protein N7482_009448 [Penicillium canariense]KAJ5152970.1 hypothetical protein N7482_009448 [Penicillium canariense]